MIARRQEIDCDYYCVVKNKFHTNAINVTILSITLLYIIWMMISKTKVSNVQYYDNYNNSFIL